MIKCVCIKICLCPRTYSILCSKSKSSATIYRKISYRRRNTLGRTRSLSGYVLAASRKDHRVRTFNEVLHRHDSFCFDRRSRCEHIVISSRIRLHRYVQELASSLRGSRLYVCRGVRDLVFGLQIFQVSL